MLQESQSCNNCEFYSFLTFCLFQFPLYNTKFLLSDDRSNSLPLPSSPIVPNSSSAVQNLLTETSATATRIVQPQEKEKQLEQTDIALPNIDPGINVNEKTENFDSGISSDSSKNNTKDMNSMAHLLRQQNNTPNV